jgi:hypothetical protein
MKKYKFLLKPLFFIFNLLFATWLVFKIEKIQPSDFGRYKSLFEKDEQTLPVKQSYDKFYIIKLAEDYKNGKLSKILFEKTLSKYLEEINKTTVNLKRRSAASNDN